MRGAFSCSVSPGADVQSITWFFESAIVNQDPTPVNISDPNVLVESAGGTSVLILDNVGTGQEGSYHCEAQLTGGTTLNSTTATLDSSGATSNMNVTLLPPPSSLTVTEGDVVLVPCVGSVDPMFSGSLPAVMGGNVSSSGLTFTADRQDNGILSCNLGTEKQDITIEVLAPIQFEVELVPEPIRFLNTDTSPILFPCEVSGNPSPTISFLVNGKPVSVDGERVMVDDTQTPSCRYRELHITVGNETR
jgi:hypothetical protein